MFRKEIHNFTERIRIIGDRGWLSYFKISLAAAFLLFALVIYSFPQVVIEVSQAYVKRELPIYCVDRDDKVVALTFDAAWGAY